MFVLILGINHQIQGTEIWSAGSSLTGGPERFERDQKTRFKELLERLITDNRIQFVAEETAHGKLSIAEALRNAKSSFEYSNVDMDPDDREGAGIKPNYENLQTSREQMQSFNLQREQFMFDKTITEAKGVDRLMVICGRNHTAPLAGRFRAAGHQVKETDVGGESWYVDDWQTQMMRL
jgi:hypothetical protein